MKVVINTDSRFDNFSLLGFEEKAEGMLVDIQLPSEVEEAVKLTKKALGTSDNTPVAFMDDGNHGFDGGIVFRDNLYQQISLRAGNHNSNFPVWQVTTRISVGPDDKYVSKKGNIWDGSLARLHLGVWAGRTASPKVIDDSNPRIEYNEESINFSLRWVDGKFDDWNDPKEWKKDLTNNRIDRKSYEEKRTTHYKLVDRIESKNNNGNHPLERWMLVLGERKSRLPALKTIHEVARDTKITEKDLESMFRARRGFGAEAILLPTTGYKPSLEVLSQYGNVKPSDAKLIPTMTPKEGVSYLYERILPAMMAFARS